MYHVYNSTWLQIIRFTQLVSVAIENESKDKVLSISQIHLIHRRLSQRLEVFFQIISLWPDILESISSFDEDYPDLYLDGVTYMVITAPFYSDH